MDNNNKLLRFGFTLIEMIVVLGIVSILSGFGIAKYNSYNQQLVLRNQADKIVSVIELAKKKATSADLTPNPTCEDFRGYRVSVHPPTENTFYLRFNCGGTYTTIQTYTMEKNISAVISSDVVYNFLPLEAGTNLTTNSLRLKNSVINQCIDISISPVGIININETLISC